MKIIKRNGQSQDISFDKILHRIKNLSNDKNLGILKNVEPDIVSMEVIKNLFDGVSSSELDELASRISVSLATEHPEYGVLASRIIISNMHKNTQREFSRVIETLYNNVNENGEKVPLVSKELFEIVKKHKARLNNVIDYTRDYLFDYFGFKTLERSYLLKTTPGRVVERPQTMWMRVSLGINSNDIDSAIKSYNLLSQGYFTHATPTLFNFGTPRQQGSSCFLLDLEDSMKDIYKCLSDCAIISKHAGGIGLSASKVRSSGSHIKGTNGKSDGIIKMLKVFNETARFSNQGSRRNGSIAIYLEVFHDDIFEFLDLRKNSGDDNLRARDLFYALWICDAFMEAVEKDLDWYLMSPDTSPGLTDVHSAEFESLYYNYIAEGKYKRKIRARDLWNKILVSQIETGMPYVSYKDSVNSKTNHQNLGTIQCSNLCNEILIYSNEEEYGTCNIATLGLPKYVERDNFDVPTFDFVKLYEVTKFVVRNLNHVIDKNFYPVKEAQRSNSRSRPIAIGIQGLANVFFEMRISYTSPEAKVLNKLIFETIYFGALEASVELAISYGPYPAFDGSPFSKGILQFDMWGLSDKDLSGRWDWNWLRERIKTYGTYNSLTTALPPTASTSQILGNYESFEPVTSNFFMRSTLSGDFPIVNKYLVNDLIALKLWNTTMKERIILHNGSIQKIEEIPDDLKDLYKTVWEIPQRVLIELSADRAPFIDHTQSLNIYMESPTLAKLTSMHFYGWKKGLKTGMYYLRSKPTATAQSFSIDAALQKSELIADQLRSAEAQKSEAQAASESQQEAAYCSIDNKDACLACSG